ncbi:MAG: glycine cleavage system aminomethyltransferase GcvT [Dehalococcoidales bacterium]|nr:glycine cleavage system aminomethyltransferase GcvT [Dehalococcoidales bacterium]
MQAPLKKTPLHETHLRLGARMIEFGGWLMPVQYSSILEEHRAVRQAAGIFDLFHMGEIEVRGAGALELVQKLTTNDASRLADGQAQYSLLCYEDGGVVDDVLVYRLQDSFLFVVNAANIEKDYQWMSQHVTPSCELENVSDRTGLIALQGPLAGSTLQPLTDTDLSTLLYYHCRWATVGGVRTLISRTGYTGEDGFELFCTAEHVERLWNTLLSVANPPKTCGLGARDTLRLEAAMPLYGHELDATVNPFEARLGWVVKLDKPRFVGKEALARAKQIGPRRQLVGLEILDRTIARSGFPVLKDGDRVGHVSSGTFSPTLERSIALGYVPSELAQVGCELSVAVRERVVKARVVPIPFYKRRK